MKNRRSQTTVVQPTTEKEEDFSEEDDLDADQKVKGPGWNKLTFSVLLQGKNLQAVMFKKFTAARKVILDERIAKYQATANDRHCKNLVRAFKKLSK